MIHTIIIHVQAAAKIDTTNITHITSFEDPKTLVMFASPRYVAQECHGMAWVDVIRVGDLSQTVSIAWYTEDATAAAGTDYEKSEGTLEYLPGESAKAVQIPLYVGENWEPEERFFVKLRDLQGVLINHQSCHQAVLSSGMVCQVPLP